MTWVRPRDEHGRAYFAPNETPPADEQFAHWQGRLTHPSARCNGGACAEAHANPERHPFRCYGGWIPSGEWWLHCSICRPEIGAAS